MRGSGARYWYRHGYRYWYRYRKAKRDVPVQVQASGSRLQVPGPSLHGTHNNNGPDPLEPAGVSAESQPVSWS
ncbi:unnamed protein product [Merluccius merluccius]